MWVLKESRPEGPGSAAVEALAADDSVEGRQDAARSAASAGARMERALVMFRGVLETLEGRCTLTPIQRIGNPAWTVFA